MELKKFFIYSSQFWLATLLVVNCLSLLFLNGLDQKSQEFSFTYAALVANIFLSYAIILYILWVYRDISTENEGPFHQWIWFSKNPWCNGFMVLGFISWIITNLVMLSDLAGIGYFLMLFFVISVIYWTVIGCCMMQSYCNPSVTMV